MKLVLLGILFLSALTVPSHAAAQSRATVRGGFTTGFEVNGADTTYKYTMAPIYVFAKPRDMRRYERLVRNVKIVYPLAKEASAYLDTLETELAKLKTARQREAFTQRMEKEIVKKYTPVLRKMTFSQGKILIKLIDRETDRTAHGILKEFRGSFTAGFWNTIAKIFKADLKQGYDKEGDDAMIEQIILMHEAGLL